MNRHSTVLLIADRGLLIAGPSGSGKTTLALALLSHCRAAGIFARLVSDDQVHLAAAGGRAVATAPKTIAGQVEAFGAGPTEIAHEGRAVIDLMVELVEPPDAQRFCECVADVLPGISVRVLKLEKRMAHGAVFAIASLFEIAPFPSGKT